MTDPHGLRELLEATRTIAIVGLSADPGRPSYRVASYLQAHRYRIVPVNPRYDSVLGERCYPDLASVPFPVELVDVFRRAEDAPAIATAAVAIGARALWLQLGIASAEAREIALAGGLQVVMDRCIMVEHRELKIGAGRRPSTG